MKRYLPMCARRGGFTLVELLVVIGIVALLASLLLPVLARSREQARKTQCTNNLAQFHKALVMFDQNHDAMREDYPMRLTYMHTGDSAGLGRNLVTEARMYQCPCDPNRGAQGGRPASGTQFTELDEGPGLGNGGDPKCAADAPYCSYMYEFSGATCNSSDLGYLVKPDATDIDRDGDGRISWQDAKFCQMERGDSFMPSGYPPTWFPIMRCFWHAKQPDQDVETEIFNLAVSGNFFPSGPRWEYVAKANNPNAQ